MPILYEPAETEPDEPAPPSPEVGTPTGPVVPPAGGYSTIQDEGVALPPRSILNVVGAGVTASDTSTRTVLRVEEAGPVQQGTLQLAGDLGGTALAPRVQKLLDAPLDPSVGTATSAQVLTWTGSAWAAAAGLARPTVGTDRQIAYALSGDLAYAPNVRVSVGGGALELGLAPVAGDGNIRGGTALSMKGLDGSPSPNIRQLVNWGGGTTLDIGDKANVLTAIHGGVVRLHSGAADNPLLSADATPRGTASNGAVLLPTSNTALVLAQSGQYIEMGAGAASAGSLRVGSDWSVKGTYSGTDREIIIWGGGAPNGVLQLGSDDIKTEIRGDVVEVRTSSTTRLRVDDTLTDFKANYLTATTGIALFAAPGSPNSWGGGSGIVFIANATTVPSASTSGHPSGGGFLYVEAGYLKWKGPSGTVTVLGVG